MKGLVPEFFFSLRGYSRQDFVKDLTAGIIVGVVALPLAIAFGIASGVSPTEGLLTAIIGGFLVSLLGGSKVQIGGADGRLHRDRLWDHPAARLGRASYCDHYGGIAPDAVGLLALGRSGALYPLSDHRGLYGGYRCDHLHDADR